MSEDKKMENEEKEKTEVAETEGEKPTEEAKGTEGQEEAKTEEKEPSEKAVPEATEKTEGEGKRKQSREEDSYYAKKRKEWEATEAENAKLKKQVEAYRQSERDSFSDDALKDLGIKREELAEEDNLKLAKYYVKGLAEGEQNPTAYAYRKLREEANAEKAEKAKAVQQEKERTEAYNKAFDEISKTYGSNAVKNDIGNKDSAFMKEYGELVTEENIARLYTIYRNHSKELERLAKKSGTPPTNGSNAPEVKSDAERWKGMTQEQLAKEYGL